MNKNEKILLAIAVLIGILFALSISRSQPEIVGGLTSDPFQYTHLSSANASSTAGTLVRGGAGVLGNVTINTTSGQIVKIYDGNSSATSTATLMASIVASAGVQTLTYNVAVTKGIVIETPASYVGSLTVSHK